jgi:hypothetical protein
LTALREGTEQRADAESRDDDAEEHRDRRSPATAFVLRRLRTAAARRFL